MTEPTAPTEADREQRRRALESLSIDREPVAARRRRRRIPGSVLTLIVIAVLVGGYVGFRAATAVPVVRVASVLRASPIADREITTANGYIVARIRASVASKTQGRLRAVLVDEGDLVEQDQLLAEVDHDDLDASVAEAEAQLEKATRAVPAAQAQLRQAQAVLETVNASIDERKAAVTEAEAVLAESVTSYRRTEELVQRQITSDAELDRARQTRDVAQARLRLAQTALATAQTDVARATAGVDVQREQVAVVTQDVAATAASLDRAKATRENAFIRAPFAGMVLRREAEPGEVVSPANTGGSGSKTAVITLADFSTLEIEVDVYERDIAKIGAEIPCRIVLDAYPDVPVRGHVRLLRPTADRTRATVQVYVAFDTVPETARPEMVARVTCYPASTDVLTPDRLIVPAAVAATRDGEAGVFVLTGKRVRFQKADLGPEFEADGVARREVRSGLDAGLSVVVAPPAELADDMQVAVEGD